MFLFSFFALTFPFGLLHRNKFNVILVNSKTQQQQQQQQIVKAKNDKCPKGKLNVSAIKSNEIMLIESI